MPFSYIFHIQTTQQLRRQKETESSDFYLKNKTILTTKTKKKHFKPGYQLVLH